MEAKSTRKSEVDRLCEAVIKALNNKNLKDCESKPALIGNAMLALEKYKAISSSLRGFPNEDPNNEKETDPRWKLPPLNPRADT